MKIFNTFKFYPRFLVLKLIKIYQKTLSPDHGPLKSWYPYGFCRFHPTCSQYGYQAIEKYGIIIGGAKAFWRILRCNPWSKGGEDLLKWVLVCMAKYICLETNEFQFRMSPLRKVYNN